MSFDRRIRYFSGLFIALGLLTGVATASENNVRLATGDVSFPVSLASLPGSGGLGFDVNLFYSSNVQNIVNTWNLEAPTGVAGLGWTLPTNKIIRNSHATGTVGDDDFYLVDQSGLNRFDLTHCERSDPNGSCDRFYYETAQYQPWQIEYNSLTNEWTVIKENGVRYLYGGEVGVDDDGNKTSRGSSIEWRVKWDNWLGSSVQGNQKQYASSWNLAVVENTWEEQLTFSYAQTQAWVGQQGEGNRKYTQSTRLAAISTPTGHRAVLSYLPKLPNEYEPAHKTPDTVLHQRDLTIVMKSSDNWDYFGKPDPAITVWVNDVPQSQCNKEKNRTTTMNYQCRLPIDSTSPLDSVRVKVMDRNTIGSDTPMFDHTFMGVVGGNTTQTCTQVDGQGDCTTPKDKYTTVTLGYGLSDNNDGENAYQDRYGKHYLHQVDVYNGEEQLHTTQLNYTNPINKHPAFLGTDKFAKRLLTGITYTTSEGEAVMPPQRFSYWGQDEADGVSGVTKDADDHWQYQLFNAENGALYGALKTLQLPQGGEITYFYDQKDISASERKVPIEKPDGNWDNPRLFWGPDYVVVTWQGSGQIHLSVYQWVGYWKKWTPDGDGIFETQSSDKIQVEAQADFFALVTSNGVSLFHQNLLSPGEWQPPETNSQPLDLNNIQVASGERFFVLLSEAEKKIYRFTWRGQDFESDIIELSDQYSIFGITARNNYFFTASAGLNNTYQPELKLHYLTSYQHWGEKTSNTSNFWPEWANNISDLSNRAITLVSGNSFVTLQASSDYRVGGPTNGTRVNSKHYIVSWSQDYSIKLQELEYVRIINKKPILTTDGNNLVTLAFDDDQKKKHVYRFNGVEWLNHPFNNDNLSNNFWGYDSFTTTKNGKAQYRQFEPYSEKWLKKFPEYKDNNPTLFQKVWAVVSEIEMVFSLAFSEVPGLGEVMLLADAVIFMGDIETAAMAGGSSLSGIGRYFTAANKVYYLQPDGTWQSPEQLVNIVTPHCKSVHGCIPDSLDNQSIQNSSTFITYVMKRDQTILGNTYWSKIRLLKNGQLFGGGINLPGSESLHHNYDDTSSLVGPQAFVSYHPKDPKNPSLKDATALFLYRVADDNITTAPPPSVDDAPSPALDNTLQDFVVSQVQINTGTQTIYTHYDYNTDSALSNSGGTNAVYHQVSVIPSGSSNTPDTSNGFTVHYFLNGNPNVASGDGTQTPFLTSDTVQKCVWNGDTFTCDDATNDHLGPAQGIEYYAQICENAGGNCQEVAHTRQKFKVFTVPLDAQQFQGVFTRPWLSSRSVDGRDDRISTTAYTAKGFPASTSSTQYNLAGNPQTFVTRYTYLQDVYSEPSLQALNLLSPVVQTTTTVNDVQVSENDVQISETVTTWQDWGEGKWAPFQTYQAGTNNGGNFDWGNPDSMTPPDWVKTSEITALETATGAITETQNRAGVYQSILYDLNHHVPVATFAAARASANQAGYLGFEAYEDPSAWAITGTAGQSLSHSGQQALIGNEDIRISPSTFSPTASDALYIVSAWVKPLEGQRCGLGFGSIERNSTDSANWQYLEVVTTQPDSSNTPQVQCSNGGHIDDVRYGPVAAPFAATVYDPSSWRVTARLGSNGDVQRYVYNQTFQPIAVVGPNEQPTSATANFYSRQVSDSYEPTSPNASLSLSARKTGMYFDFQHQGSRLWSDGVVSDGALTLSGASNSRYIGVPAHNAATRLRVMPDGEQPSQQIGVSVGDVYVKYIGDNSWELWVSGNPTATATATADFGQDWLIVTVDQAVLFYVNGQQIFSQNLSQSVMGKSLTLRVSGDAEQSTSFADILVFSYPVIGTAYSDGFGQLLQQQSLENDTTVIAAATLYDDLGRAAVATKPIRSTPAHGLFQYQPDLATINWQTGEMSGLVAAYYGADGEGFSNDEGFPYSRQVFEQNPLSRPVATGLPGNDFSYQVIAPNASFESTIPDTQNITEYDYGTHPSYTDAVFDTLGISNSNQPQYDASTRFTPWSTPGHIPTVSIRNLAGQLIGQQSGTGDLTATAGYQDTFDTSGNSQSSIYAPNYYYYASCTDCGDVDANTYISTHSHNVLGQLTDQTTPDNHQTQYRYDDAGRLRFLMNANGAVLSPNRVLYWKYDTLGRVMESGYIDQDWDTLTGPDLQNASGFPATPATWRQQYHYDDNERCDTEPQACSQSLKGRLFRVAINTDQDIDTEATESYTYDLAGRRRTVINAATEFSEDTNTISYTYDQLGNMTAIDYGSNPDQANLQETAIITHDLKGDTTVNALDYILIAPDVSAADGSTTRLHAGDHIAFTRGFTAYTGAELSASAGHPHNVVRYDYNQLGQLVSIGTSSNAKRYGSYTYNANGSIQMESLNNEQLSRRYGYNSPGWLTRIVDSYFTETLTYQQQPRVYNGSNIASVGYTFLNAPSYPNDTAPPDYQYDYRYDALGRLQSANASSATDGNIDQYDLGISTPLGYDVNGNIINLSRGTDIASDYTYYDGSSNTGPNQVATQTSGGALYCYDYNGNMIGRSSNCADPNAYSQTLSYDPFSQLTTEISSHDTQVSFSHGIGTRRLTKVVSGDTPAKTLYLHGTGSLPLIEKSQSGNNPVNTTYYIYGPTGLIASNNTQENYFFSTDHLGSTRVVSQGSNNEVQAYYNYTPFGQLMADHSGGANKDTVHYRYTGQEYDTETGLYNYRARIYDPGLARFYSTDPVQESFGPYTYVGNNPVRFTDPTGMMMAGEVAEVVENGLTKSKKGFLENTKITKEYQRNGVNWYTVATYDQKNSFVNSYSDIGWEMHQNFRTNKGVSYYANNVVMAQYDIAAKKGGFEGVKPTYIERHNVINLGVLHQVDQHAETNGSRRFLKDFLEKTENGKSTVRIIEDLNMKPNHGYYFSPNNNNNVVNIHIGLEYSIHPRTFIYEHIPSSSDGGKTVFSRTIPQEKNNSYPKAFFYESIP